MCDGKNQGIYPAPPGPIGISHAQRHETPSIIKKKKKEIVRERTSSCSRNKQKKCIFLQDTRALASYFNIILELHVCLYNWAVSLLGSIQNNAGGREGQEDMFQFQHPHEAFLTSQIFLSFFLVYRSIQTHFLTMNFLLGLFLLLVMNEILCHQ